MRKLLVLSALLMTASVASPVMAGAARRVIVYDNVATEVGPGIKASDDAWLTLSDLKRATGFEIKPQGVCRNETCYPIPKTSRAELIAKRGGAEWFNLSAFSRMLKQPVAYDQKHSVWVFGPPPAAQNAHIQSLDAPDFTLPDINGKMHSLSDFRGKKVLLITWASW